jgi:hypothetical protein
VDPTALLKLLTAGGAGGIALVIVFIFVKGWVVPGPIYQQALEREKGERERAEKAEQRLLDTIPTLQKAMGALDNGVDVTRKAIETVKSSDHRGDR